MRRMSKKAQKRYREAKPVRDQLRQDVGRCEVCYMFRSVLDVHEICRGPNRQKALDQRYALLLVCRLCHEELGSAAEWPEAKQLALLANRRLYDWDLRAYLELTNPRAPKRILIEEVMAYMDDKVLKVDEVADLMRVNRRTAQSWIDSGQLPAVDVRPDGATRAMWRIELADLLAFAQERKTSRAV